MVILLLTVVLLKWWYVSIHSKVEKCLHGLFALWCLGLQLVQGIIQDLTTVSKELSSFLQINLDYVVFCKELTNSHEDILEDCLEHLFVDLSHFCHLSDIGLSEWLCNDIVSFLLKLSHLRFVDEVMVCEEALRQLNVQNSHIFSHLLVSNDTKIHHVDCSTNLSLALAPFDEGVPAKVIGGPTGDISDLIGITTKISLYCFITKKLNIKVAVTTWFTHIHILYVL